MDFIADFHIHSKYSRATSKDCCPEMLDFWARQKGIDLVGTGDFTHAAWRKELGEKLTQCDSGLYALKSVQPVASAQPFREVRFVVSGEISSIYKKNGKTRKVHNVIILPDLASADRLSARLEAIGNLHSDGRPILGLDSKTLLDMTLSVCPNALFIPAHIWTPHFSVLGAHSGFDSIEECFEDLTGHIYALETGLSSDPPMNWRLSQLDRFALVSNSDAHSPGNLAREANIFSTDLSYDAVYRALKTNDRSAFTGTIEFFPEEGKYHFDGHRACKIQWEPGKTIAASGICPVCGGKLTVGVLHRVEELADRPREYVQAQARKFERIVPLAQVVGASIGSAATSVKAVQRVRDMVAALGPELTVIRSTPIDDIKTVAGALIAEGIRRVRAGELYISAGYDGQYGIVEIFTDKQRSDLLGQTELWALGDKRPSVKKTGNATAKTALKKNEKNPQPRPVGVAETFPYGLNDKQWEAVSHGAPAIAVIAGPGTGKTHTLISRIAYLVNERAVVPTAITALTFTNKAAQEMRRRLTLLFKDRDRGSLPCIGTFHTVCLGLLREHNGARGAMVIDQAAALGLMKEAIDGQNGIHPAEALRAISRAKAGGPQAVAAFAPEIAALHRCYQEKLASFNAMDFDDILLNTLQLLERDPTLLDKVRSRFAHVLVDEFQDINEVQYLLIKQWARAGGKLFVIGDPHQSIYGFRGASPRYFETFTREYGNAAVIALTRNYRSSRLVAAAAQSVIGHAADAHFHGAAVEALGTSVCPVRLVETKDEFSEALFITKEINRMVGGVDMLDAQVLSGGAAPKPPGSRGFSDFAVLYRTHRQAAVIEHCFFKEGIQYRIAGSDELLGDDGVRNGLAFFRYLSDPRDILSFLLCCKQRRVEDVSAVVNAYAAGPCEHERLDAVGRDTALSAPDRERLAALGAMIRRYKKQMLAGDHCAIVRTWVEENDAGGQSPLQRLPHFAELHPTMESFLSATALGREADLVCNGRRTVSSDAVLLSTLHAAKGLEFPVVFVCGVNDGLIPFKSAGGVETDIEEERRLFYVGLTRAKEELICTLSRRRTVQGMPSVATESCFVKELGKKNFIRELYRPEPTVKQMSFL